MKLKYVRVQYSSVKLQKRPTLRVGRALRLPRTIPCRATASGSGCRQVACPEVSPSPSAEAYWFEVIIFIRRDTSRTHNLLYLPKLRLWDASNTAKLNHMQIRICFWPRLKVVTTSGNCKNVLSCKTYV